MQSALDDLIPTLNFNHQSPTDAEIQSLTDKVGKRVQDAISDNVSVWDWLKALGNEDDKIGGAVFYQSQTSLCRDKCAFWDGVLAYTGWSANCRHDERPGQSTGRLPFLCAHASKR